MLDISEDFLKPGGHGHVFCSFLQVFEWAHASERCKETVALPGGEGDYKEERKSFGYQMKDILYFQERDNYTPHPSKSDSSSYQHD